MIVLPQLPVWDVKGTGGKWRKKRLWGGVGVERETRESGYTISLASDAICIPTALEDIAYEQQYAV